jgi:hypothetical protein
MQSKTKIVLFILVSIVCLMAAECEDDGDTGGTADTDTDTDTDADDDPSICSDACTLWAECWDYDTCMGECTADKNWDKSYLDCLENAEGCEGLEACG